MKLNRRAVELCAAESRPRGGVWIETQTHNPP